MAAAATQREAGPAKLTWRYGQGTELRMVRYVPNGSVFLQNVGEDDNGVIELPAQLLDAIAAGLRAMTAGGAA